MKSLKRHPAEETLGVQNAHVLAGVDAVQRCVGHLMLKGFTVLSVRIGHREPTVLVQREARCEQLREATVIGTHDGTQLMAAPLHGCSVQWVSN